MSLGSGCIPHWCIGNPYGPVPGQGFFWLDEQDVRQGPYTTKELAQVALNEYTSILCAARSLSPVREQ